MAQLRTGHVVLTLLAAGCCCAMVPRNVLPRPPLHHTGGYTTSRGIGRHCQSVVNLEIYIYIHYIALEENKHLSIMPCPVLHSHDSHCVTVRCEAQWQDSRHMPLLVVT